MGIIALNAIWIAVDTDYNQAEILLEAHPVFQIAEHFFCAFFVFEWLARFMSFRYKAHTAIKKTPAALVFGRGIFVFASSKLSCLECVSFEKAANITCEPVSYDNPEIEHAPAHRE
eukprot:3088848-Amphidinium_carterae.1